MCAWTCKCSWSTLRALWRWQRPVKVSQKELDMGSKVPATFVCVYPAHLCCFRIHMLWCVVGQGGQSCSMMFQLYLWTLAVHVSHLPVPVPVPMPVLLWLPAAVEHTRLWPGVQWMGNSLLIGCTAMRVLQLVHSNSGLCTETWAYVLAYVMAVGDSTACMCSAVLQRQHSLSAALNLSLKSSCILCWSSVLCWS